MTNFALIGVSSDSADYKDRDSEKLIRLKTKRTRKSIDSISVDNVRNEFLFLDDVIVTSGTRSATDKQSIRVITSGSSLGYSAMASALSDVAARLNALAAVDAHKGFINVTPSILNLP